MQPTAKPVELQKLFKTIDDASIEKGQDVVITGLSIDSRTTTKGDLFIACSGYTTDGAKYIDDAIQKGAVAVLAKEPVNRSGIASVVSTNPRQVAAQIAAAFYQKQPSTIIAITGTNGKTSVAHFCKEFWKGLGYHSASIGTIGVVDSASEDITYDASTLTTPDVISLHKTIDQLAHKGVTHLAIEASSHGLSQYRLDGLKLTSAAFTNFTQDHLDYHKTMEAYFDAKTRLFTDILPSDAKAIWFCDHEKAKELDHIAREQHLSSCVIGPSGHVDILSVTQDGLRQHVVCKIDGETINFTVNLVGEFQIRNLVMAMTLLLDDSNISIKQLLDIIPTIKSVPGRMQIIPNTYKQVVVDFAHTADALDKALSILKEQCKGRLMVVFGCGGDRDASKRSQMGRVAFEKADQVIITDDNPRTEDPATIRRAIMMACPEAIEIADRKKAIAYAIEQSSEGDIVLIAGKGHETSQIIGTEHIPFSDVDVAKEYV